MPLMKAVRIHAYGGPDVLQYEDAPRPTAGEGELLIRVYATTVNPFDCAVHAGYMDSYFHYTFPLIPGTDAAGVIEDVGKGVAGFARGDEVYARGGVYRDGANAEYLVVFASDVARKPASLSYQQAAALPHVTLTAWQALIVAADVRSGQTVLIHGAAGGVGHIAVQLARRRGARVIGTASVNYPTLIELGVDQPINYATTRFEDVAHDVDVVLDTIGGDTQERSWAVLKPGGILVSTIQPPSEEEAKRRGVRTHFVATNPPIGPTLTEIARMADAREIVPIVSSILPLREIRKAHEMIEGHHTRGKLVLDVEAE